MPRLASACIFPLLAALFLAAGCAEPKADPAVVAKHRKQLELTEEPDGAQTVLEVRQVMYGLDADDMAAHEDHDHDGDGVQDHAPEDHAAAEGEEHAHDHEHEDHNHGDHDHADDAGDDAEEPAADEQAASSSTSAGAAEEDHAHDSEEHAHDHQEHAHTEGEDHDHAHADEHAHDDHDHEGEEHAHEDHDHDGDGVQDHTAEEHDAALVALDPFKGKEPVVSEMDVVMVGAVGGVANPSDQSHPDFPFSNGQAVFFLADPEAVAEMEEHEHKHAPGEECAFCAAHAGDSAHLLAVVQFTDEKGKPIPVDARDLFDLKEKETVVVKGKATIAPGGMLTINATGLYARR